MFEQFKARAEAVSAEVHRFATDAEALRYLEERLQREGVARQEEPVALWCEGPLRDAAAAAGLPERLPGLSFEVTRERAARARVGISEFDWGLADTGSLAQDATDVTRRLVSTLSELHLAVVRTGAILPDLAALLTRVQPEQMRYLACVTGPSRTADIERVLTIGVHGPRQLVILAVDEAGRAN